MSKQDELFQSTLVPGKPGSGRLFDEELSAKASAPVTCLGQTFPNDEARRAHFTELLRQKLLDPEFRKIEGFPIGKDEDILALSDPPYYTACPNPWIADFIAEWEAEKPEAQEDFHYHREPFAADVSEGKNDPIYNAHSYHTKVPHKAIMRYILHYTEPGDIVFDGFCGTGMTGVAAQMCGDRNTVVSLGYQVKKDGTILQKEEGEDGREHWVPFSKLGARKAVLNDLSPAATFIAYNYNTPVDAAAFEKEAKRILKEVEKECGWMYETMHTDGKTKGKINYTVWSDVFVCPECAGEIVFWEVAVDRINGKVLDAFKCPHCESLLNKRSLERKWESKFDEALKESVRQVKQIPVWINYSIGSKRHEKALNVEDLKLYDKIEKQQNPYWHPTNRMMHGKETRRNDPQGLTHVHYFYFKDSLFWLAALKDRTDKPSHAYLVTFSLLNTLTKLYRYVVKKPDYKGQGGGLLSGTLYAPSLVRALSTTSSYKRSISRLSKIFENTKDFSHEYCLSTGDAANSGICSNSIDYLFIDPPFGSNLYYSELSHFWESWLKIFSFVEKEAVENSAHGKGVIEYRLLMTQAFKEAYRVLKPGHWMTVEFSNTKASVWNSIQAALTEAGFIVANVSALDKKQGSFKAVTTPTAVKQDLVISAYKPNGGFEERFQKEAQTEEGVWDFIRTHLGYLPVTKMQAGELVKVPERDPRILFDQVVSYYVRKGFPVPIDSAEFQAGLAQRFEPRDEMYFLADQVAEYDKAAARINKPIQLSLFVSDEASAIEWLRNELKNKPQTSQDLQPGFMKELSGVKKSELLPEMSVMLNQNFICYDGKGPVPEQIHAYLSSNWKELRNLSKEDQTLVAKARDRWYVPDPNKAGDLEKLRERALLKEFEVYKAEKKKLKVFRLEAVRAGFKRAWQDRDYSTIVTVAERIPNNILEEDPKLLMWYDQAVTRKGDQ